MARNVMNALFRCQTMSGLRPSKMARKLLEHVLTLGLRCEAPTRAFFHLLEKYKESEEAFDADRDMKAWHEISEQRFGKREAGQRAKYLYHMSEVMTKQERREWDFLFQ